MEDDMLTGQSLMTMTMTQDTCLVFDQIVNKRHLPKKMEKLNIGSPRTFNSAVPFQCSFHSCSYIFIMQTLTKSSSTADPTIPPPQAEALSDEPQSGHSSFQYQQPNQPLQALHKDHPHQ